MTLPAGETMPRSFPFTFVLSLALAAALAPAAGAAEFRIEPADSTVTVGDPFTLRVVCDAVPDLKGFQTAWSFPAALLQLQAMPAGNVLTDGSGDWFAYVLPDAAAPADTAWMDAAKLDGAAQGPGVAAYLQFTALEEGHAPVTCVYAEMRDSNNASLAPTCLGGMVHVVGPVPAAKRSWGRLKALYR